ncbi:hypothetical protein PLICRDRAFT_38240 [Plicaturopsis crispa FD-325 SS-3]|nr:hypothetical protein PLICRDRAFT_38240 [Plicaturopsis crispa FD-325 SS-3]
MNVLIYAGPEVSKTSLSHTLTSLRSLVLPHYTVQTISPQSLISHPWSATCALLVLPSSRQLPSSESNTAIQAYVERGGAFLGFSVGVDYSSPDQGVLRSKSAALHFSGGSNGKDFYPKFCVQSTDVSRTVSIRAADGARVAGVHEIEHKEFAGVQGDSAVKELAQYDEGGVAAVKIVSGKGRLVLWGPSLEYPVAEDEQPRLDLLRASLLELGLELPATPTSVARPLPQFLVGNPSKAGIIPRIIGALAAPLPADQLKKFEDANDTFRFSTIENHAAVFEESRSRFAAQTDASSWQPKEIIVCPDGTIPSPEQIPLFDIRQFFADLTRARKREGLSDDAESWGIGEALLYSEIVTSTQTMLDKNPRLLSSLPTPVVSLASQQLAGRGRGGNVWLSPAGCLQFSVLLRTSLSALSGSKLVFIQYLWSLAVAEACREESVLGKWGEQVRLKWPNDVYAVSSDGAGGQETRKIGGTLINTSFTGGNVDIVIGSGLNVLNAPPITSLSQLAPPEVRLSMERTAAAIMAKFEKMWSTFLASRGSFEPFMSLYTERWLHSDQLVTLTTTTPPQKVRITGITPDHGLLRTVPERTGWSSGEEGFIDLQPDGNSFDLMSGLIRSKAS